MDFLDGRPIREVALGDLDGDGDLDVFAAMGKPTMGTIDSLDDLILLNDGKGSLAAIRPVSGQYGQHLGRVGGCERGRAFGCVGGDEHRGEVMA